jgi:hypothetical protein
MAITLLAYLEDSAIQSECSTLDVGPDEHNNPYILGWKAMVDGPAQLFVGLELKTGLEASN